MTPSSVPAGPRTPSDGARSVAAKRPGMELVVAAQKSVALLGLIGRAENMHSILDAETDATLAYLDTWMMVRGGRRGRSQKRGPTHGLIWARTRHATSRAGDPEPHDHVLIANMCHMADGKGGWKAVDTAALRDILHAATAFGRVASAAKAIELDYAIEPDDGQAWGIGVSPACPRGRASCSPSVRRDHRPRSNPRVMTPTRPARPPPGTLVRPSGTPRRPI